MGGHLEVELEVELQLMENRMYVFHRHCDGRESVTYHACHKDPINELASILPGADAIHRVELELSTDGDFNLLLLPTVTSGHIQVTAFN